jgi:serine/threonine-protein kinase
MGTPLFMAPEQCMGRLVDGRTDVYALGVLLYRIFSGQYPFTGTVVTELVYQHVADAPAPPSRHRAMPPDLERIILDCLAKDPAARPQSARVLYQRLEALALWPEISVGSALAGSAPLSTSVPAVATPRLPTGQQPRQVATVPPRNRSRWLLGLGAIMLVTGGVFVLRTRPARQSPPTPSVKPAPSPPVRATLPAPPPLARLRVMVENGADNRVVLDGKEIAHGQSIVEIGDLEAGRPRHLLVEAPARKPFVHEFTLSPGGSLEIPVVLQPEEREPARRAGGKSHVPTQATPPAELPAAPTPAKPIHATPRRTRAQERGLLDSNPLRAP